MKRRNHLWKNEQGLAAVEFAFVLPILITMLLGLVELSQALACRADVTNMASTGADLIAQESSVTTADMQNVFNALNAMLFGFDTAQAKVTISSIIDDGSNGATGTVAWTCSTGADSHRVGDTVDLPQPVGGGTNQIMTSGGSLVLSEITYQYNSPIAYFLVGTKYFNNSFYTHPRRVAQIPMNGACP
jgi:Flp pilus assembly protein TadG